MANYDIFSSPVMRTIPSGVIVQRPFGEAVPPTVGPTGGFSVGACHLEGAGPVVNVAIHHPDGETMIMTLGIPAFQQLAELCNAVSIAIEAGSFDKPEPRQ